MLGPSLTCKNSPKYWPDEPNRSRRSFEVRRDSVLQSIEFRRHDEVIAMETSNLVSPESDCHSAPFC